MLFYLSRWCGRTFLRLVLVVVTFESLLTSDDCTYWWEVLLTTEYLLYWLCLCKKLKPGSLSAELITVLATACWRLAI
jgi:hypothetical protein